LQETCTEVWQQIFPRNRQRGPAQDLTKKKETGREEMHCRNIDLLICRIEAKVIGKSKAKMSNMLKNHEPHESCKKQTKRSSTRSAQRREKQKGKSCTVEILTC